MTDTILDVRNKIRDVVDFPKKVLFLEILQLLLKMQKH